MPKISKTAQEQSTDSPIEQVVNLMAQEISISTNPVFICGVNRKINIGNFENIDVYAGVTIPLGDVNPSDREALAEAVKQAAMDGFSMVSRETGERYTIIKDSQQGK
jgi:hypothetical protein